MTLEIIQINDPNMPKYDKSLIVGKQLINWKSKYVYIAILILPVIGLFYGGISVFFSMLFYTVVLISILYFPVMVIQTLFRNFKTMYTGKTALTKMLDDTHLLIKQHLEKNGFKVNYESTGILIDEQAKKLAFTLSPKLDGKVFVCSFDDVMKWNAYSKGVEKQNEYGAVRTLITSHHVSVYIRNPEHPRFDFMANGQTEADVWVARLDALIN